MTTINEKSPIQLTVNFLDADGNPIPVVTVEWRLIDVASQTVQKNWTSQVNNNPLIFSIPATDNTIVDTRRSSEDKDVIIRVNTGLSTEAHETHRYTVNNLLIE